jgi:DNA (cytosine-5)-methyltransferase 3A
MNVLSLFDGMSCGQIALNKAGIEYDNYYASEIDKYAIQVTKDNFPNTVHLGDVTKIDFKALPKIDLLIGGSPCQGFSFAGKQLNFNDPRSALFFEYVRALKELKPKWFLLENVRMKKEFENVISEQLGVMPILINSSLVSAQNRNRLYWTNISGATQPEDKKIYLKDIIEELPINPVLLSDSTYKRFKGYGVKILTGDELKARCLSAMEYVKNGKQGNYLLINPKYFKGTTIEHLLNKRRSEVVHEPSDKPIRLGALSKSMDSRVYHESGKSICISAQGGGWGAKTGLYHDDYCIRKLTPLECKRLQTVPDDYRMNVSNTQAYKMLGNGWTVDVIAHIFKNILNG